jgi:hypothetical protein
MSVDRRDFIKVGTAGLAGTYLAACNSTEVTPPGAGSNAARSVPELHIRIRGLCLLERADHRLTVHVVDGPKVSMPPHRPRLIVRASAIDTTLTPRPPDVENPGQSIETWLFDLAGQQVSVLDQSAEADSLVYDTSDISGPRPGDGDPMTSTKWVPDLKRLSGATRKTRDDAYNCQIVLKRGRVEGTRPSTHTWTGVVWTFKNPSGQTTVEQALTDTVLYRCPLNGQPPVIKIGSTSVTLRPEASEFVIIQNYPTATEPPPPPTAPFTLGHFAALYGLVDSAFTPIASPEPRSRSECGKNCDIEPIFCPPAEI